MSEITLNVKLPNGVEERVGVNKNNTITNVIIKAVGGHGHGGVDAVLAEVVGGVVLLYVGEDNNNKPSSEWKIPRSAWKIYLSPNREGVIDNPNSATVEKLKLNEGDTLHCKEAATYFEIINEAYNEVEDKWEQKQEGGVVVETEEEFKRRIRQILNLISHE